VSTNQFQLLHQDLFKDWLVWWWSCLA